MKGTILSDAYGMILVIVVAVVCLLIALVIRVSTEVPGIKRVTHTGDAAPIKEDIEYETLFAKAYPTTASIGNGNYSTKHPFFKHFIATMYTNKWKAENTPGLEQYINQTGLIGYDIQIWKDPRQPIQIIDKGTTNYPIHVPLVFKDMIGFLKIAVKVS